MVVALSAIVVSVIGALAAGLGAFLIVQERGRRRRGVAATGLVVDNVHGAGSTLEGQSIESAPAEPIFDRGAVKITPMRRAMGYPVVEFTTSGGEVVRFRSSYGSQPPAHRVGDTVTVYYDTADPRKAEVAGGGSFLAVVFLGLGVLFLGVAAALWTFGR